MIQLSAGICAIVAEARTRDQHMKNTTTDNQVTIKKTISATSERVTFSYQISSPQSTVGRLRLVEQFSEPIESTAVRFDDHDHGQWEYETTREIAFTCERPPPDPIEVTFHVQSQTLDPQECVSKLTTITAPIGNGSSLSEILTATNRSTDATDTRSERIDTDGGTRKTESTTAHRTADLKTSTNGLGSATKTELPAIGIFSIGTADEISRTVFRARQHNLAVFVAVADEHSTTAQIVRRLGATVVETADSSDIETQKTTIRQAVEDTSYPGLIFHQADSDHVDFEASLSAFETCDELAMDAISESEQTNVLVGIPAYNEAETVKTVVESARDHADEVLVVDDGSTDRTASRAHEAGATVVEHGQNRGYGGGLKTIFKEADQRDVDALVILDGDDQHDVRDIPRLLEKQRESDVEIIIGNRFGETVSTDIPLYRRCGLWVITLLLNISMGNLQSDSWIQDTQSGFRLYNKTAIHSITEHATVIDDGMSASTDILYHAHTEGFTTAEVPTTITYDVSNANSRNPITHGVSVVNRIITTLERERPVTVLGIPGFLIAMFGVGLGYWTTSNYVTSGTVAPEFVMLSVVLVLLGNLFLFVSAVQYSLNTSFDQIGLKQA